MKATAKYMFDEDFSSGEKAPTITLVEAERRRVDAESLAYRKGFAAGQEQAQNGALALIADGMERLDKALAGPDRARAIRRDFRAGHRILQPSGEGAARRRAYRRRGL